MSSPAAHPCADLSDPPGANPCPAAAAQLIGLDWGSSRLRALLIGAQGQVLQARQNDAGASTLHGGAVAFSAALDALIGDWRAARLPIVACGMVGSAHGWREVPYAECPAGSAELAAGVLAVEWHGQPIRLLPGLRHDAGTPDVMRGEETQVIGALALHPALGAGACLVMPGTHSKWAQVRGGAVVGFATQMTGELFALLRQHSVLGRLMPAPDAAADAAPADDGGFARGLYHARDAAEQAAQGLLHQLFSVRTLGLTQQLQGPALAEYLSGLLIGHELRSGLQWRERAGLGAAPLVLVGEAALCRRYAQALALYGQRGVQVLDNTAAAGLWRLWARLEARTQGCGSR